MGRRSQPLTDEQRRERRRQQHRQLEQALGELLTCDGWARWLRTRSVLHGYSARNTLLISHQAFLRGFTATHVAGFKAWLRLGRCVRRGERGLTIWAPMRVHASQEPDEESPGDQERRTIFRTSAVFDVSQTDPLPDTEPAPLAPPLGGLIEGDSHAHLLEALAQLVAEVGYTLSWARPGVRGAAGTCRRSTREITVDPELAPNRAVAVLIHELCHALIAERGELSALGYGLEEVIVESASYVACASAGLAIDVEALPYIAGWAAHENPLGAVRRAALLIDELAGVVEAAIAPTDDDTARDCPQPTGAPA